jgi:hypothetical protein
MGGAYLYLPRKGRERPRELAAWLAVALQHIALICAAASHVQVAQVAQVAQMSAALVFALHAWPRIKSFGS